MEQEDKRFAAVKRLNSAEVALSDATKRMRKAESELGTARSLVSAAQTELRKATVALQKLLPDCSTEETEEPIGTSHLWPTDTES